jgi:hypothetical protein
MLLVIVAILLVALYFITIPPTPEVAVVISEDTVKLVQGISGDHPASFVLPQEVVYYLQGKSGSQIIKVNICHKNMGIGLKLGHQKKYVEMTIPSDIVLSLQGKVGQQSVSMSIPAQIVSELQGKKGNQLLCVFM